MKQVAFWVIVIASISPVWAVAQFDPWVPSGWEWESTTTNGVVETPETVGYTVQYLFEPPGNLTIYRDRNVFFEGSYNIGHFWVDVCCIEYFWFEGDDTSWTFGVVGTSVPELHLSNGYGCPPDHFYPATKSMVFSYIGPVGNEDLAWGALKARYR